MEYRPTKEQLESLSFSIVVETENLGMAGIADLEQTLDSLKEQTYPITQAKEVLLIAGGHVSPETITLLHTKYPWAAVCVESGDLEYTGAKMRGAERATGNIVVFADSDVVYDKTWLENMLYTFMWAPGASIVAGETRIRVVSIYTMAIQLIWMSNITSNNAYPRFARNFYLNNFAIKKDVMLSVPFFTKLPLYRSSIAEWIRLLKCRGYSIVQAPHAKGYHAPPGNFWDWWYRMLIFGADEIVKADFYFSPDGTVVEKYSLARRFFNLGFFVAFKVYKFFLRSYYIVRERWTSIGRLVLSLPIVLVSSFVIFVGALITLCNRDYLFTKITAREHEHVV